MDTYKTIEYRDCTIKIEHDPDPENPREWGNLGIMVCWHRRYKLGDVQPKGDAEDYINDHLISEATREAIDNLNERFREVDSHFPYGKLLKAAEAAVERRIEAIRKKDLEENILMLPLYLYDHSGITMSVGKFTCPWDSGQVGFIYMPMKTARENWPDAPRAKGLACLLQEVETYDHFLTGQVFGWRAVDPEGEEIDSCWGYYGYDETKDDAYMIKDCAKPSIDSWCEKQAKESTEKAYWAARDVLTT